MNQPTDKQRDSRMLFLTRFHCAASMIALIKGNSYLSLLIKMEPQWSHVKNLTALVRVKWLLVKSFLPLIHGRKMFADCWIFLLAFPATSRINTSLIDVLAWPASAWRRSQLGVNTEMLSIINEYCQSYCFIKLPSEQSESTGIEM